MEIALEAGAEDFKVDDNGYEILTEPSEFEAVHKAVETAEIKPHPYGVELGVLMQMFRDTKARNARSCLQGDFSRVSARTATEICKRAKVEPSRRPSEMSREQAEAIHKAIQATKIMAPPTDCIAPIGDELIEAALRAEVNADFYASVTRRPAIYRGNPFLIEIGLVRVGIGRTVVDYVGDPIFVAVRCSTFFTSIADPIRVQILLHGIGHQAAVVVGVVDTVTVIVAVAAVA